MTSHLITNVLLPKLIRCRASILLYSPCIKKIVTDRDMYILNFKVT
jgi:hypothetical protein